MRLTPSRVIRNGKYEILNVFDGAEKWAVFHDGSGKCQSDELIVQANVWCPERLMPKLAYELEFRNSLGQRPLHYCDIRRQGEEKTAREWLNWYLTKGVKFAPFGLRVFESRRLQRTAVKPIAHYNRQAKVGILHQIREFLPLDRPIELSIFLDSDSGYCNEPTSKGACGDNFPVYIRDAIAYHTCCRRRDRQKYPRVLVRQHTSVIQRSAIPSAYLERFAWRILQLVDLLAGSASQSIAQDSDQQTKALLGRAFSSFVTARRAGTHFVECVDLSGDQFHPRPVWLFRGTDALPLESLTSVDSHTQTRRVAWQKKSKQQASIRISQQNQTSTSATASVHLQQAHLELAAKERDRVNIEARANK